MVFHAGKQDQAALLMSDTGGASRPLSTWPRSGKQFSDIVKLMPLSICAGNFN